MLQHRPEGVPFEGVELHYFCLRGLGELPRLMLEVTGTAYDSVMYFDSKEYRLQSIRVASLCVSLRVSACLCVSLCVSVCLCVPTCM